MFIHVQNVTVLDAYRLRLEFDDGVVKEIDLADELYGEVFEPLKKTLFFRKVKVNPDTGTVEWPNGADFAVEFLYENGVEIGRIKQSGALAEV